MALPLTCHSSPPTGPRPAPQVGQGLERTLPSQHTMSCFLSIFLDVLTFLVILSKLNRRTQLTAMGWGGKRKSWDRPSREEINYLETDGLILSWKELCLFGKVISRLFYRCEQGNPEDSPGSSSALKHCTVKWEEL